MSLRGMEISPKRVIESEWATGSEQMEDSEQYITLAKSTPYGTHLK